jgi:hypothetical protein
MSVTAGSYTREIGCNNEATNKLQWKASFRGGGDLKPSDLVHGNNAVGWF